MEVNFVYRDPELRKLLNLVVWKLNRILQRLDRIERKEDIFMPLIDDTLQDVQDEKTVIASAVTLLESLSAAIAAAGTDPVKLQAIKDGIDQNKTALAQAVVANTPAAPATT